MMSRHTAQFVIDISSLSLGGVSVFFLESFCEIFSFCRVKFFQFLSDDFVINFLFFFFFKSQIGQREEREWISVDHKRKEHRTLLLFEERGTMPSQKQRNTSMSKIIIKSSTQEEW